MISSLGIRVKVPKKENRGTIYFAVVDRDENGLDIKAVNQINIPTALEVPEQLAFIRTNFLAVINQYGISSAGLRVPENIAQKPVIFRTHIEGVLQELFANSSVSDYQLLNLARMSKGLSVHITSIKESIKEKDKNILGIDDWETFSGEERESIFSAITMNTGGHGQ